MDTRSFEKRKAMTGTEALDRRDQEYQLFMLPESLIPIVSLSVASCAKGSV